MTTPPVPMIGETFSHYRVLEQLGAGGMGVVFKAEDVRLGRLVAVKFLPPHLVEDRQAHERFQREARTASSLNHPGICTIYDIDEYGGRPFIAMELLEGDPLDKLIAGKPLHLPTLVDFAIQVSDALDAAHHKGVLHRDIKPGNIFVTRRGQIKILDFGLAKLVSRRAIAADEVTAVVSFHTTAGTALGTVAYMSPEQARGEELDHRTDLFSFGVVLYEMATGRQTFAGATSAVIFDAILNRTPTAPMELNTAVPPELERVIAKALEKDRQLRYQTASDIRADLHRIRRDLDSGYRLIPSSSSDVATPVAWPSRQLSGAKTVVIPAPPRPPRKWAPIAWSAGVLGVAFVAAGSVYFARRAPAPDTASPLPPPPQVSTTSAAAGVDVNAAVPSPPPAPPVQAAPVAAPGVQAIPAAPAAKLAERGSAPGEATARAPRNRTEPASETLRIARAKADAKLFEQAVGDARTIVLDHPSTPAAAEAYLLIGHIQEEQKKFDDAMATYVELRNRDKQAPQSAEAGIRLADLMIQSGDRDRILKARDTLADVAATHPDTDWAPRALARKAQLEDRENFRDADPSLGYIPAAFNSLRALADRYPTHPLAEQALWRLAQEYQELRRVELAAGALQALVTRFPQTRLEAWWQLGELYEKRLNDKTKAREAYARVPASSPRYAQAQKKLK